MPHISYDLDGDGFVGGRDYIIAKQFDKDGDGRLNTNEKKNALEAVKNVTIFLFSYLINRELRTTTYGMLRFKELKDNIEFFRKEE